MLSSCLIDMHTHWGAQDLVCVKCKMVKADNLSLYCRCSGSYAHTTKIAALRQSLCCSEGARVQECA